MARKDYRRSKRLIEKRRPKFNKCSICYKFFNTPHKLKIHSYSHQNLTPYECELCDNAFAIQRQFTLHMNTHPDILKHTCYLCK